MDSNGLVYNFFAGNILFIETHFIERKGIVGALLKFVPKGSIENMTNLLR